MTSRKLNAAPGETPHSLHRREQIAQNKKAFFDKFFLYLRSYYGHFFDKMEDMLEDGDPDTIFGFHLETNIGYTLVCNISRASLRGKNYVIATIEIKGGDKEKMNVIGGLENKLYALMDYSQKETSAVPLYRVKNGGVSSVRIQGIYKGTNSDAFDSVPAGGSVEIVPVDEESGSVSLLFSNEMSKVPYAVHRGYMKSLQFAKEILDTQDFLDQQDILHIAFNQNVLANGVIADRDKSAILN